MQRSGTSLLGAEAKKVERGQTIQKQQRGKLWGDHHVKPKP